jgi:hypothetical protein
MARGQAGGGISDYVLFDGSATVIGASTQAREVVLVGGATVQFFSARTGGVQYTDLLDESGVSVTEIQSSIGADATYGYGQIPMFSFPDGVAGAWASANNGPRSWMQSRVDPTRIAIPFEYPGNLVAGIGTSRWYNQYGVPLVLAGSWFSLGQVSSSGAVTLDIKKNGTTIYTTTGNRPTAAAGSSGGTLSGTPNITAFSQGDYLTFDIVSAGIGAGDLVGAVMASRAG